MTLATSGARSTPTGPRTRLAITPGQRERGRTARPLVGPGAKAIGHRAARYRRAQARAADRGCQMLRQQAGERVLHVAVFPLGSHQLGGVVLVSGKNVQP